MKRKMSQMMLLCMPMMMAFCLFSCANGNKAGVGDGADSAAVANAQSMVDSAHVADGNSSETDGDIEPDEGAPILNEEYDVSVRTFDLDSQDPGPGYEAIIRLDGKTLQVVEGRTLGYPEDMLEPFGNVWLADADFDGHTDVLICLGMEPVSDQSFMRYDAWLFNPDDGKFYCPGTFREITNPEIDVKEHRILGHYIARDGKTKVYNAYYWQRDGNIQPVGDSWQVK